MERHPCAQKTDCKQAGALVPALGEAGLAHLKRMTLLEWLNLEGTDVREADLRGLREALPRLKKVFR